MISRLAAIVPALFICASTAWAVTANDLKCEYQANPLGVDSSHPRLSWRLKSAQRGVAQTAYRVLVASDRDRLSSGRGDMWDSGVVRSSQSAHVPYSGAPLTSRSTLYWKVMVWDSEGKPSPWSGVSTWRMGLLKDSDWSGKWIGATANPPIDLGSGANGFHAYEAKADGEKWLMVDLGASVDIEAVRLFPAHPTNYAPDTPGFGFPVRFRLEASDDPGFVNPPIIADHTGTDYPNPGTENPSFKSTVRGRYVRLTATRQWKRLDGMYCFAMAEMQVISGGKNVALHRPASASDSIERADWNCAAVTDGSPSGRPAGGDGPGDAAAYLRKDFVASRKVTSAVATICGLGYYELYLNGKRIGDHRLDPGWTDYNKRCLYVTYDVTNNLTKGANAIGVILGNGWLNQSTPDTWGFQRADWRASSKLRFDLCVTYSDGSVQRIGSDDTWRWSTAEIVYQNIRSGETHDFRLAKPGWSAAGFDDAKWRHAVLVDAPKGVLRAQGHPAIKVAGEVPTTSITEPKPGVYVFRLARNIAGWPRFRATGPRGTEVTLQCGEWLNPDGTVNRDLSGLTFGRWQKDGMVLSGGVDTFEPHFTYHGFQYVQVEGLATKPSASDLVGVVAHTSLESTGDFACSNPLVNRIHTICVDTYLNNLYGVPTDCPQREKLGWMCDGYVASRIGMYNFDAAAVYEKWIRDMADDQREEGFLAPIVPSGGWARGVSTGVWSDPLWCGVTVLMPWRHYLQYGDPEVVRSHYASMKAYMTYLQSHTAGDLIDESWCPFLGDWLEVGSGGPSNRTPAPLASNAGYFDCARVMSQAARLLGKDSESAEYTALASRIATAINARFLNPLTGKYAADSQTGQAMALTLGFAPEEARGRIADALIGNIHERDNHISAGIVGVTYVMQALTNLNANDVALAMVTRRGFPGWVHMLESGSSTVWEAWPGQPTSLDHPAFAVVDNWFYEGIAGIRQEAGHPGFDRFVVKPAIVDGVTWARASTESPYGRIASSWRIVGSKLRMTVTIPPNSRAAIYVPASSADAVTEGDGPAAQADGLRFAGMQDGCAVFDAGSGTYQLVVER